ncbi:MAG: DNA mismatch repair protein MutS [Eubacterium sp.]|nr:DNA mismatch repair protein MutS [Eubacterium sp.]
MKLSPMMEQYKSIKADYDDSILFFRLGDFYEMFFEDAKLVSRLLELTLTGKSCGMEERAPMCGVPFHAADSYIEKLVRMGYKVAICEQLEDPAETKGMVKRGVVQVVTPGTVTSGAMLRENENNYLASAFLSKEGMALAYCDISTGELYVTEKDYGANLFEDLINQLVRIDAREVLINQQLEDAQGEGTIDDLTGAFVHTMPDPYYSKKAATDAIRAQFGDVSLTALGLEGRELAILTIGVLLSYLFETQKQNLEQLTNCRYYEIGNHMTLDKATIRNLELTETLYDKTTRGSLLWVLDKTSTAMGGRKMRQWLREPLNDAAEINQRLTAVETLVEDPLLLNNLVEALKHIYDFERLAGRIASGNANGKDMIALRNSTGYLPDLRSDLANTGAPLLQQLAAQIADLSPVHDRIQDMIVEEPPYTVKEGGLIRNGCSAELDDLKDSIKDAKQWIAGLENSEKERTGIQHLKVGYNKVFGYYIEISRSNLDMAPEEYVRKQTLVGGERFITPELKEKESLVLNAETKINKLEYDLFTELRKEIGTHIREIQETSAAIAALDVLCAYATVSGRLGYTKPVVDDSLKLEIRSGRHPVIEQTTEQGMFVANDTYMDEEKQSMLIITGPNMAGKSTYMRQTALIVLMAQAGCFVPCESARIGVCDRIFTRIGASDNLAQGQSTFFVEMSELAYILRNAGPRSLVILDEIGRGTSTYDGLSIAWSTVEYLCNEKNRIRTLFATHYHEMTALEESLRGVVNLNVDVSESGGNIVFLHKIVPGSASRSYGVHVARLAGVPEQLLSNAENKLTQLENEGRGSRVEQAFARKEEDVQQISFFAEGPNPVLEQLRKLDLMEVTPSKAIAILEDLKEMLDD